MTKLWNYENHSSDEHDMEIGVVDSDTLLEMLLGAQHIQVRYDDASFIVFTLREGS